MGTDPDELVRFHDVRILRATGPTLLCLINGKSVWLPRHHVSGKLWCIGDRGTLFIRRWVARDRQLIDSDDVALAPTRPPRRPVPAARLHLV